MKILFIGSERSDAQAVAGALRGIDRNVGVSWASRLDLAARWIGENRDVSALIVQAPITGEGWPSLLKQARGLAVRPAVVVITPDAADPRSESLEPGVDDYVAKNGSLLRDLPVVVTRTVSRIRQSQQVQQRSKDVAAAQSQLDALVAVRADLEQKLSRATAALEQAEQRHQAATTAHSAARAELEQKLARAATDLEQAEQRHQAAMAAHSAARTELEQRLSRAATDLEQAEQRHQAATTANSAARAELEQRLSRAAAELEQKLSRATAALAEAEQRHQAALTASATQMAERQVQYDLAASRAEATWQMVEEQLRTAALEVEHARQDHAAAIAEVERLSRRESELSSRLAEAITRGNELQSQLADEMDRRRTAEDMLADAVRTADDAARKHESEMRNAAAASSDLDAALQKARGELETTAADLERLTRSESHLTALLDEATTDRAALERRLAATESAFQEADARATRERLDATRKAAAREAELDAQIRQERARAATFEQAVADAAASLTDAEQRHQAAADAAARERADREDRFGRELAQVVSDRDQLAQRLGDTEASLDQARRDHQSAAADVDRLTQREADLTARIASLDAGRLALEQTVADGVAALNEAQQRHEAAIAAAARELADRQSQFEGELARLESDRDELTQRLTDTEAALDQARRDYESAAADVDRLRKHEAELTSQIADLDAGHLALEQQLTDDAIAMTRAAEREAELQQRLHDERAARALYEQAVADADVALRDAQQRYDAAQAAATRDLAERQEHFDRELSRAATDRDILIQRVNDVETALDHAWNDQQSAASEVDRLTQREAELAAQLADVQAARHSLDIQWTEATSALAHAAEREAELDESIRQERAKALELEQVIADANTALRDAQRRHEETLADVANDLAARQSEFDRELSQAAAAQDDLRQQLNTARMALDDERHKLQAAATEVTSLTQRERELTSDIRALEDARDALQVQLNEAANAIVAAEAHAAREREEAADHLTRVESRLAQEMETREILEQALGETRSVAVETERALHQEADAIRERAIEREAYLEVQLAQAQLEHESRMADEHERARTLTSERDALNQSLVALRDRADRLAGEAARVPGLQAQIAERQAENHRLFQQAGLPMVRCTREGVLTQANRAFTTLVGRRTGDDLSGGQFATTVFEAPDVLSWLIERCVSTRAKESIETTWLRKDGGRLFVRLSACQSSPGVIEIVAEDLTRLRILEERLGQAHRMEAVGRLASEVAVTCGNLLDDIHQNGQTWLNGGGAMASRQHGERLLDEVQRAAGLLRQLAECRDEQARTPVMVDLNTLVRDLEPVLKRVAGDDVDIHVRDSVSALNLAVGNDRVERLLVNLASYSRERMPLGGRLGIELGTTVVDRRFAAKHPNVRLGLHALITVTGSGRTSESDGSLEVSGPSRSSARVASRPGVDLGTLQRLVNDCGGHLWMTVQRGGDMVAKIRLPLKISRDHTASRAVPVRSARERTIARFIQH